MGASIAAGTTDTHDIGSATRFRNIYGQVGNVAYLEVANGTAVADFWRHYLASSSTYRLASGAGGQDEIQIVTTGATDTQFGIRGTMYPLSTTGSNGDLGYTGTRWRKLYADDGDFSDDVTISGTLTLPTGAVNGYVLTSDASGNAAWAASSGGLPVVDTTAIVKGSADATKLLAFEVDGLTTATTRTLTVQDYNYTIAGTNIAQTFSGANTFSAGQTFSGNISFGTGSTYDIGTSGTRGNNIYFVYGNFNQVDIPSGGAIDILSGGNLQSNGSNGLSVTKTVRDAAGTGTCTLIFGNGILTGGTC
jgi:hypothetical protein